MTSATRATLLVALLAAPPVAAQPPAGPAAGAQARCLRLFEVADYAHAIDACKSAFLADGDAANLFTIAQAYNNLGDPGDAIQFYRQFLIARGPAYPSDKRRQVEALIDEQTRKLATRTPREQPSVASLPVTPASTPARPAAPSPPPRTPAPVPVVSSPVVEREAPAWYHDSVGDTLLAVGAAGLLAGGTFYALGLADAHAAPWAASLDQYQADQAGAHRDEAAAVAFAIGGAASVGVAIAWDVARAVATEPPVVGAAVTPRGATLSLSGEF